MDKLVHKYYPRLKHQLKMKPKFAHKKDDQPVDWLAHVKAAAENNDGTVSISSDSSSDDDKKGNPTPTNVDTNFKSKLNELFEVSP